MQRHHGLGKRIIGGVAATAVLFVGCASESGGAGSNDASETGGVRQPGNEAIPDIGRLSTGGTMARGGSGATVSGDRNVGGTGAGGSSNAGGSVSTNPSTSQGGTSATSGGAMGNVGGRDPATSGGSSAVGTVSAGRSATDGGRNNAGGAQSRGGAAQGGMRSLSGGSVNSAGTQSASGGGANSGGTQSASGGSANSGGSQAAYHTLPNWVSPQAKNLNHHGRMYFIAAKQQDDQGLACNSCHGTNLEGNASAPACASCHADWRGCTSCHGTGTTQSNPPRGVFDETALSTLAVGRHVAHLTAGSSHAAVVCSSCHSVPATNDLTHLLGYVPSSDLSTSGHHGDVLFSGAANGTTWNVNATTGSPVTARGTCIGACHSNGRGGNPAKTPYWAGGTWTTGCTNCHAATGSTRNSEHGHGFPGSTCADCHTGATATSYAASTHMNGTRDFRTNPGGAAAGMRLTANWSCSNVPCH